MDYKPLSKWDSHPSTYGDQLAYFEGLLQE